MSKRKDTFGQPGAPLAPRPRIGHIQESRRAQRPKEGAKVEYPVPFPPVAHNGDGEVAVPTGDEQWFPATVKAIEHHEHVDRPDDHVAILETDHGLMSISVVLLRKR